MAQRSAQDIADAWDMLYKMCIIKQYPMDIAENRVQGYQCLRMSELEAIRKVYHEVANG